MTTHGGYTLLLANNPVFYTDVVDRGWGSEWTKSSFDRWQEELQADLKQLGEHATELDRDRWQSLQARQFISEHPSRFLKAVLYRIRSLWTIIPQGDAAAAIGPRLVQLVGWYYAAELLAFAAGIVVVGFRMVRAAGARPTWWLLLLALVVTVQAVHLAYWTNARMRAPILPVISLLAVAAICRPDFQSGRPSDATR